ncbi:PFL family protein [Acidipropionibacterium thoenii]|uniref:PFL family protein n=1 Tax=Acidipropionibacterium thoenii TaxID=1751 RepID=UPI0003FCAF4B|nr:PFL family protein [Acidipropionibacterium thoenii]
MTTSRTAAASQDPTDPATAKNILETIRMIEEERLDIRTVTMGISLLDCIDSDGQVCRRKIYDRITTRAQDLVATCQGIEAELGIPIINKRITVTPISLVAAASGEDDYLPFALTLDAAAKEVGVDFLGGFTALVDKGRTHSDKVLIDSIPQALAATEYVCSSVNIGSSRAGINMSAVAAMGRAIKQSAELTASIAGLGAAKLVVFANAVGDNPFMAGGFHGIGEADCCVSVGVSGPGVIKRAVEKVPGRSFGTVAETIKKAAFKVTRMGQLVGTMAAERLDVPFGIVDLSLAPTPAVGDSVARILEEIGVERVGAHGTTAALFLLNDAVKKGGMMACSHVGGLSGSFIPVSEDIGMIEAAGMGAIGLDKLEAMTAICSVGLDMIALPGSTSAQTLAAIIADEAAIGVMNHKTTAVRLIPVPGKEVGDQVEFGGLLGRAPILATSRCGSDEFVARGGHIPAPVHAFRN